jgi:galactonate dehydratase
MAEPYYVTVSPHNYNSTTIGLAATLQVAATMPNFLITEYFVNFEARAQEVTTAPFQVDHGYIALPTTPGLGIELARRCWRGILIANFHYVVFLPSVMKGPDSFGK